MTTLTGRIDAVTEDPIGDELAVDAPAESTSLVVEDASPFNEDGGTLVINEQVIAFTVLDPGAGTLTLAEPLAEDAATGDRVEVYDPETGEAAVEYTAYIIVEGSELADDSLPATVDHDLIPYIPVGFREGEGEAVEYERIGGDLGPLVVKRILGGTPVFDSAALVGTIPDATLDDTAMRHDLDVAQGAIDEATENSQTALDNAAAAILAAEAAASDAADAAAAVEMKATIVYSPSDASSPENYSLGDLWRKTSGGLIEAEWQHDGTAWVQQELRGTMLAADAIDGKVITGATLQTDAGADEGMKIVSEGLVAFDGDGNAKTTIDASTGKITAVDGEFTGTVKATSGEVSGVLDLKGTGVIRTAEDGQRVQFGTSGLAAYTAQVVPLQTWSVVGSANGIAVGASGHLYAGDAKAKRLRKFDATGTEVASWSTTGAPNGVALDSSENVYVLDTDNNRVRKYSASGATITSWSTTDVPHGIAIDSANNVYVNDIWNGILRKYTSSGTAITTFDLTNEFYSLAVDSSGNIYVPDWGTGDIYKYNSSGALITSWPVVATGGIYGLALDSAANVYVTDTDNSIVHRYNSTGGSHATWEVPGVPYHIAVDSVGDFYVADSTTSAVRKYNSSGSVVPSALIESATGRLFATDATIGGNLAVDSISPRGGEMYISGLARPGGPTDAANKAYVDGVSESVSGISPFTATDVKVTRVGNTVTIQGSFARASGSSTAFTTCGGISDDMCPSADVLLAAQPIFSSSPPSPPNMFQFVIRASGSIEVRQYGTSSAALAINATWTVT